MNHNANINHNNGRNPLVIQNGRVNGNNNKTIEGTNILYIIF